MLLMHLPMNGDFTNLGYEDADLFYISKIFADGGIYGNKCYQNSKSVTGKLPSLKNSNKYTVAMWVYLNTSKITYNWIQFFTLSDGADKLRFTTNSTNDNLSNIYISNDIENKLIAGMNTPVADNSKYYNKWIHLALVVDNTIATLYIDGKRTVSCTAYANGALTGDFEILNSDKVWKNDIRIYNHALSHKEVIELSKCLVTHIPLIQQEKARNVIADSRFSSKNSTAYGWNFHNAITTYGRDDIVGDYLQFHTTKAGDILNNRISFDAFPSDVTVHEYMKKYTLSFWAKTNSQATIGCGNAGNIKDITIDSTWKKYYITYVGMKAGLALTFNTKVANTTVYLTKVKLEVDENAFPEWTPSWEEEFDGIEYDVSGYANNGSFTKNNCPKIFGSAIINNTSYEVQDTCIKVKQPLGNASGRKFSVSMWVYVKDGCGELPTVTSDYNAPESGFWIAVNTTYNSQNHAVMFCNGAMKYSNATSITKNEWHHIVVTYDGTSNAKIYIDKVLDNTINVSDYPIYFTEVSIGNSTKNNLAFNTTFNGCISDYRIYATEIDQNTVNELYDSRMLITSDNQLMTRGEIIECSENNFKNNGIVNCSSINEVDGNLKISSNGLQCQELIEY